MNLSPKFWWNRCDRLFEAADRLKEELESLPMNHGFWRGESRTDQDAYDALRKMQKMNRLYEEAAVCMMVIGTLKQHGSEEAKRIIAELEAKEEEKLEAQKKASRNAFDEPEEEFSGKPVEFYPGPF